MGQRLSTYPGQDPWPAYADDGLHHRHYCVIAGQQAKHRKTGRSARKGGRGDGDERRRAERLRVDQNSLIRSYKWSGL